MVEAIFHEAQRGGQDAVGEVIACQMPWRDGNVQIGYGVFMLLAHLVWFSLIALCFSAGRVRLKLTAFQHWIDRIFGRLQVCFGVLLDTIKT